MATSITYSLSETVVTPPSGGGGRGGHAILGVDRVRLHQEKRNVVGQDGQHVDNIHRTLDEFPFLRRTYIFWAKIGL